MHRFHKSSLVVAALSLITFLLMALPGQNYRAESHYLADYTHGWPWVFLDRHVNKSTIDGEDPSDIPYIALCAWSYQGSPTQPPWLFWSSWQVWRATESQFRPLNLFLDLIVALLFTAALALAWELRQRRRTRLLQFTSRDLLLAVSILAATLGWWCYHAGKQVQEEHVVDLINQLEAGWSAYCHEQNTAPEWLKRLVGTGLLENYFSRICLVQLVNGEEHLKVSQDVLLLLEQFEHLQTISLRFDPEKVTMQFSQFAQLSNMSILNLVLLDTDADQALLDNEELSQLASLQQLREIHIVVPEYLCEEQCDAIQKSLPNCQVVVVNEEEWWQTE